MLEVEKSGDEAILTNLHYNTVWCPLADNRICQHKLEISSWAFFYINKIINHLSGSNVVAKELVLKVMVNLEHKPVFTYINQFAPTFM